MSNVIFDIARLDVTPLLLMKLKVAKTVVDQEFERLKAWKTWQHLVYVDDEVNYCVELLMPKSRRQCFNAIIDFEAKTVRVEHACGIGRCDGGWNIHHKYMFSTLDQIEKTFACWSRFVEFIKAIAED